MKRKRFSIFAIKKYSKVPARDRRFDLLINGLTMIHIEFHYRNGRYQMGAG